jgi:ankyrin repeat protein
MKRRILLGWIAASGAIAAAGESALALGFPDWYTIATAASQNKMDDVRTMLSHGDNPNTEDPRGRTALSYAAGFGDAAIVKLLLDNGARVDSRDQFGATPLHWAAENGRIDVVRLLIAAKASVDALNRQGITPLMLAAGGNKADVVHALLVAGADPKKQDFTGRDTVGWAAGRPAVLRVLQAAHAG